MAETNANGETPIAEPPLKRMKVLHGDEQQAISDELLNQSSKTVIDNYNQIAKQVISDRRRTILEEISKMDDSATVIVARPKSMLSLEKQDQSERNPESFRGSIYRGVSKNK